MKLKKEQMQTGLPTGYLDAKPDIEVAIDWAYSTIQEYIGYYIHN